MKQIEQYEEKKKEMKQAYDAAVSIYEENRVTWKAFPLTPEGEAEKKRFSIRTGYTPSRRPKTPAMEAFERLRGIWSFSNEWPNSKEEIRLRENILLSPDAPEWAYHVSALDGKPWIEAEQIIANDAWWAFEYAQDVVGRGNETIEKGVLQNPKYTYLYARFVVKGQFLQGEEVISKDPRASMLYAQKVMGSRFIPGESAILDTEINQNSSPSVQDMATEYRQWCHKIGTPIGQSSSTVEAGGQS